MTNYAKDKSFGIPAAFTALNGAVQTFEVSFVAEDAPVLVVEPKFEEKDGVEVMVNAKEVKLAQDNLLRVLEVLRSNGAQPIITAVEEKKVTFTVEQVHVYGLSGERQVHGRDFQAEAKEVIEGLFEKLVSVDGKSLKATANVQAPIGALI
jgi:hypothetical protein